MATLLEEKAFCFCACVRMDVYLCVLGIMSTEKKSKIWKNYFLKKKKISKIFKIRNVVTKYVSKQ